MSTSLAPLDLTGAVVGTSVTLDFNQFVKFNPARMQQKAHLGLFNESGCGLQCVMKASGDSQYLPAGGWTTFEIESNDSNMVATVTYTLPNPPVSQLNAVYYAPGEEIPQSYTLGNSPIGIGGTVNTSSVQTLSNEGNAANTLVEDIGDVAFAQLFTLYTDGHCLWSVDQSGIKHQVVKIQTAGNPLQLGQAGDTSEVLGALLVDQVLTAISTIHNTINSQAANDMTLNVPTGQQLHFQVNGADTAEINASGVVFDALFSKASGGADTVMAITGSGATQNTRLQSGSLINLQTPAGTSQAVVDNTGFTVSPGQLHLVVGDLRHFNGNTSTIGSGTVISHGLGITPRLVLLTANIAQPGSANVGVGSFTATTFTASVGAGTSGCWLAIKE